ncbi:MAG: metallophosphoesterase [Candidatus Omnitrophota bacterium]
MIALYILILLVFLYSLFIEPRHILIKEVSIAVDNIHNGLDKIKIIHITDLHIKKLGYLERKVVDRINQLSPDILFVTGDFIKNDAGIKHCAEMFKNINAKYGIYGVLGNNDYRKFYIFPINTAELKRSLADSGVKLLFNESYTINIDGTNINIFGVEDSIYGSLDISRLRDSVLNKHINILLSHSPAILRNLNGFSPDLILTGHTHGGQVRVPLIEYLWAPLPIGSPRKYCRGLFKLSNKTKIYVNQGIGTSLLPVRFLCPPEISVIKLGNNSL